MEFPKILFIGPPGAGKGTQAEYFEESYKIMHISTGDIARNAFVNKDPLVLEYEDDVQNNGKLLPDNILFQLLDNKIRIIKLLPYFQGYILDGAVRTLNQAEYVLENNLANFVFFFDIPKEEAIKRLNIRYRLERRSDDKPEVIEKRFVEYYEKTTPAISFLSNNFPKYFRIDASRSIELIRRNLCNLIL